MQPARHATANDKALATQRPAFIFYQNPSRCGRRTLPFSQAVRSRPLGRRPTIADLARAAGVSVATVDRVLNPRHRFREPTAPQGFPTPEPLRFHPPPPLTPPPPSPHPAP